MLSLSLEDKLKIIKLWYELKSSTSVCRKFNQMQGLRKTKSARLNPYQVNRVVKHFEKEKTLKSVNKGRSGRATIINIEKQKEIMDSVMKSPKKSYRRRAQEFDVSPTSLRRVLKKKLNLFPYRISSHHVLKDVDKVKRMKMCSWLSKKIEKAPQWINNIWFSDEAHFHLDGAVNSQSNIFWGLEKPDEIVEKRLKGPKCTAFVAFNAKWGLLGPYWFEEAGKTVTINSERYIEVINRFYADLLNKLSCNQLKKSMVYARWRKATYGVCLIGSPKTFIFYSFDQSEHPSRMGSS